MPGIKRILLFSIVLLLVLVVPTPAVADCIASSLVPLNVVQGADIFTISRYTWEGNHQYDQTMPQCAKSLTREIVCQGLAYFTIRTLERPSKGTCLANQVAAFVYALYIKKAIGVQLHIRL